jgi:excisionase family DNA binding protein
MREQLITVDKRLLRAPELADYIGTTILNVYQMVSKRQIPFVKIGRSVRFDLHAIDTWIESKAVKVGDYRRLR